MMHDDDDEIYQALENAFKDLPELRDYMLRELPGSFLADFVSTEILTENQIKYLLECRQEYCPAWCFRKQKITLQLATQFPTFFDFHFVPTKVLRQLSPDLLILKKKEIKWRSFCQKPLPPGFPIDEVADRLPWDLVVLNNHLDEAVIQRYRDEINEYLAPKVQGEYLQDLQALISATNLQIINEYRH